MSYEIIKPVPDMVVDIPIIGDDIAKIGRVIDLYALPCQPTAEIWVRAMFTAIPTLFITLTKPELVDISIRHRRGKPKKGKRYRFRVHDLFRDALVEVPVPRWVVFRIYEWGQRIGWWFLVADALEDFGINWMSMAYRYNGCPVPDTPYADFKNDRVFQGSSVTPASRRFIWNADQVNGMSITGTSVTPITGGFYRCNWDCRFEPYEVESQSQMPYTTYCVINGVVAGQGETGDAGGGLRYASGSALLVADDGPFPEFQIHGAWLDPLKFCWMSGTWNVSRVYGNELGPDP